MIFPKLKNSESPFTCIAKIWRKKPDLGWKGETEWDVSLCLQRTKDAGDHTTDHFVFKPVSVQALWTVIQTLSMIKDQLGPATSAQSASGDDPRPINSSQSCINEWNAMTGESYMWWGCQWPEPLVRAHGEKEDETRPMVLHCQAPYTRL